MASRAKRNNNPGNIRHGGSAWYGVSAKQTDPDFLQFDDAKWGARAVAVILRTYGRKRKARDGSPIDTLAEVITRWAPPEDHNDTKTYIANVAKRTGFSPNQVLDLTDQPTLRALTSAIIMQESPDNIFDANQIADAVSLSFINTP